MGGAEKSLVNFVNELQPDDADIDLLLFKRRGDLLQEIPNWINVLQTPKEIEALYSEIPRKITQIPWFLLRLLGTMLSKVYSKITGNYYGNVRWTKFYNKFLPCLEAEYDTAISYISGDCLYYLVDKICAKNKMAWIHTDYKAYIKHPDEDTYFFDKLDYIVTISNKCVDSIVEKHPRFKNKVICLPNIVSSELIKKKAREYVPKEFTNDCLILASIGRLERVKGFDLAIEAANILKNKNVEFKWYIIGEGTEKENLRKFILEYGLENNVILLGLKTNPYPYMLNSTAIVQTSRFEGKSIVLDEAKILGKPIIVTDYSTVKDQLNSKEGIIVAMNPNSIAEGIVELIQEPKKIDLICEYLERHNYGNSELVSLYKKYIGI